MRNIWPIRVYIHEKSRYIEHTCKSRSSARRRAASARATRSSNTTAGLLMRASPSAAVIRAVNHKPRGIRICRRLLRAVGPTMLDDFRRVLGGLVSSTWLGLAPTKTRSSPRRLVRPQALDALLEMRSRYEPARSQKGAGGEEGEGVQKQVAEAGRKRKEKKKKRMVRKRLGKEKAPGSAGEEKGFFPVDLAKQHQLSPNLALHW
ncbi:hypothetical protein C8R47DRAFT_1146765 [Mycena vitilis]|nr:hypothetical protein C8R47DRAFT_1146765 [Mycena vitilis]